MEARAKAAFVGRAGELGKLEQALDAAQAGKGATVLVAGEAGIGKTRLASKFARRARGAGFEVLLGRSIDLVGTELPYQPFVEALRPLREPWPANRRTPGSQLRVFEETLALLTEHAAGAPVLLVLEDLHWADTSTLDLVVFLAHNLDDRPILLLATYRADEPSSAGRMRRLADGVRRSGSALVLELGPLERDQLTALLAAHADAPLPAAVADTIVARSEGNPFFAEELLAVAGDGDELPGGLRDLLLQRTARLDHPAQALLRLAAAAGREVRYPLLHATVGLPDSDLHDSLRQAVEHGVLVAELETGSFRFRHALLAEAIYATILPGEREELHARLAEELARSEAAGAAELAPHWAAAGRSADALVASVEAARQAEAVFGLAEALAHVERALTLWETVPNSAELVNVDLAELCSWAAELASQTGAAPRAVELAQKVIDLVEEGDSLRAARLYDRLGRYLHESGRTDAALSAFERALELVPTQPPSAERAQALAALADGLMLAWRFDESLAICEQALALARAVGAHAVELRALLNLGRDVAYVGRADEGVGYLWRALELAEESGDPLALLREDHGQGIYDVYLAELALWERRWTDADQAVRDGLARARSRQAAQLRVWFCAKGLRAQAELAALARARSDADAVRNWLTRAQKLITVARRAAAEASAVTPNADGWLALAEAEYARARGVARPESWSQAAGSWERLERPPLMAYCRWRQAEALLAGSASRTEATVPLREAHAVAARIGAKPLLRELELLAQRARLDLAPPEAASSKGKQGPEEILGLTPREAEVLNLVARGYTNREIAATLVISVKTASVHVSHILRKLGAPNRLEAAAIAHRLAPLPAGQPNRET